MSNTNAVRDGDKKRPTNVLRSVAWCLCRESIPPGLRESRGLIPENAHLRWVPGCLCHTDHQAVVVDVELMDVLQRC